MAYSDFKSLSEAKTAFNLQLAEANDLFSSIEAVVPSARLQMALEEGLEIAPNASTEKIRSELLVTPILLEVRRRVGKKLGYFSGTTLNVDAALGLNGECDFILTASGNQFELDLPIVTIVEAKNADIKLGVGQCVAQMVGAQRFNESPGGEPSPPIWGAVTTGETWKFLQLEQAIIRIDLADYFINQLPQILGILVHPFAVTQSLGTTTAA